MKRIVLGALFFLGGCSGAVATVDGGVRDAATRYDAHQDPDANAGRDVATATDGAGATDTQVVHDSATTIDAAPRVDAATGIDTAVATDAAVGIDAGPAVTWFGQCGSGSPRARFVTEVAPPAQVNPGQRLAVSVTFANCSGSPWSAVAVNASNGHKLGSQGPQDNFNWGSNRFALPADVAHNQQVRVDFTVTAPDLLGAVGYQWAILEEGVVWLLPETSPLHGIEVRAANQAIEICAGVTADIGGVTSASAQLQQCIDATASGGTLEIPAGIYRMTGAVVLSRPIVLRTRGTSGASTGCLRPGAPACAVLMAATDLDVDNGFFQIADTASPVTVQHLVLDGNRLARLGSNAAAVCASGNNRRGFNAIARGDGHGFSYNASVRALCGTGMEWRGHNATLVGNLFEGNGDHDTQMMWSDGLTIHEANNSTVSNNLMRDNTDVDLILGGGSHTGVTGNRIEHVNEAAFAGLMLDNFNGGTSGDFVGADVSGNTVACGAQLCDFGINLGPHAWYLSANTLGGAVHGNSVTNGKIGLNIDGAGTVAHPVVVYQNSLTGSPGSASFNCGSRATSNYNIGPDAVVDHNGDGTTFTSNEWHSCP